MPIWENRDNLDYAFRILRDGCCDGCSLGTSGMHDWTMKGIHLCAVRLQLLRLNTMPAMDCAPVGRCRPAREALRKATAQARPLAGSDGAPQRARKDFSRVIVGRSH